MVPVAPKEDIGSPVVPVKEVALILNIDGSAKGVVSGFYRPCLG